MSGPLDLGALRREREARHAQKRQRSISPPGTARKAPRLKHASDTASESTATNLDALIKTRQIQQKTPAANAATAQHRCLPTASVSHAQSGSSLQYPHGIIKKTWAFRHDRTGDDIKLEEVLEPNTLRTAVLSAFQWDMEWVFTKLKCPMNGGSTKCVFVMQAKEPSFQAEMREQTRGLSQWLRLCFPPMEGQTRCMHSKLMLLFHEHKLRVAIPSANLLTFDWGETGSMENSVFIIDLPRLKGSRDTAIRTDFQNELVFFVQKQGLPPDVIDGLLNFDFSNTSDLAFVHSVGGITAGADASRSGLASLSRAVNKHGLTCDDVEIDFAASSIGKLQDAYITLLHAAACGKDVYTASAQSGAKRASQFFQQGSHRDHSIRDKLRIYFPTSETVKASTAGAAGTICLSRDWFEDASFPRRCFRDYASVRPGLLSHNKIMFVRSTDPAKKVAWVYHGSANMSESAWGKLVYKAKDKAWHVNCRNWECGVLMPVRGRDVVSAVDGQQQVGRPTVLIKSFDKIIKPPFAMPGAEYGAREPWYFTETGQ